jgi:radical SAM superfamily enzyme YgiQ (UPF0313 family)
MMMTHLVSSGTSEGARGPAGAKLTVLLVSAFDLGHQPFGLASPAAWLTAEGATVYCLDLAVQRLDEEAVRGADLIGFYMPMHTATRILSRVVPQVRKLNPNAHLCAYGLYAPVNEELLWQLGIDSIIGGEFEEPLAGLLRDMRSPTTGPRERQSSIVYLGRQDFRIPDRIGLPALSEYAFLSLPDGLRRTVGYTEATRGCKHLCRHCPIVPVYGGKFRVVQRDIVLADIRQQVAAGAQHITFGDPDFFNGPAHAIAIVKALHAEFPDVTYDAVIKVEHLVRYRDRLPVLRDTGCILLTSAVESIDKQVLEIFDKRHTHADFIASVRMLQELGIGLNPTFVAFTPWTTLEGYVRFLTEIAELGLVQNVSPIQYAIRLLIPKGSKLLELPEVTELVQPYDPGSMAYPWTHTDPAVDALQRDVLALTAQAVAGSTPRQRFFKELWDLATRAAGTADRERPTSHRPAGPPVPQLSEPWYCCAEPIETQLAPLV